MLADELIVDRTLRQLGEGHKRLARDLREAHRFDLDQEFAIAADAIGTSRPSAFEQALHLCRLPYSLTWFEVSNVHRRRFQEYNAKDDLIKRIGCLFFSGLNADGWLAHLAWSFRDGEVNVCPMAIFFNFENGHKSKSASQIVDRISLQRGMQDAGVRWHKEPQEIESIAKITERIQPMPSLYHLAAIASHPDPTYSADAGQRLIERGMADWQNESPFWLGALALLNSHNASDSVDGPNLTQLNKIRNKKKQLGLLSFRTCRIAPRLKTKIALERDKGNAEVRAHFVRGHFKVRRSGVFWWSPHLRGDQQSGFVAKNYRVTSNLRK